MQSQSRSRNVAGILAGLALCIGSTGAIAASPAPRAAVSPFVALSALGSEVSAAALCSSSAAAAAAASQGATQGCVLPAVDQAMAPPVVQAEPLVGIEPAAPMAGAAISPLLLALVGIAAAVGLYYLVFKGNDNFRIVFPESPS